MLSLLFGAHRLHVLADPRGVPVRPGHRQQRRLGAVAQHRAAAPGARPGCQMLLCGAIAWAAYMLTQSLPYWPINPSISTSPWFNFQLDLVRCLWAMLPAAILWGASFPLALASVADGGQDPGAAGRRRLRGQHRRRDRRLARGQPAARRLARQPAARSRLLIVLSAMSALLAARRGVVGRRRIGAGARPDAPRQHAADRRRRDGCAGLLARNVHRSRRSSSPTAATRPRRIGQADVIYMRRGLERVGRRVAAAPTACSTTTTPARCRRRASRRTCACSACSGTSRR